MSHTLLLSHTLKTFILRAFYCPTNKMLENAKKNDKIIKKEMIHLIRVGIRISDELDNKLREIAIRNNETLSETIRKILEDKTQIIIDNIKTLDSKNISRQDYQQQILKKIDNLEDTISNFDFKLDDTLKKFTDDKMQKLEENRKKQEEERAQIEAIFNNNGEK